MRLLFDQNLSPRLVGALASLFPDSHHVTDIGLGSAQDQVVWQHARDHGLVIVSKDSDFMQLSFLRGAPPKVVWIRRGNCSTAEIETILRASLETIEKFVAAEHLSYLVLR